MKANSICLLALCIILIGNFSKADADLGYYDTDLSESLDLYAFSSETQIEMFESPEQAVGRNISVPAGTEFTVVNQWPNNNFSVYAKIYIDSDIFSMPAEAWVKVSDLQRSADLVAWDSLDLAWNTEIENADDSTGFFIMGAKKSRTPSCYRDVKYELLRRKLVNRYPPGAAAWMGYDVLRLQFSFKPVAFSQELPNGAVCVSEGGKYRCGKKACGHIAIKTGKGKWYGAGVFPHPLLRGHYNLRCLVKH